QRLQRGRGGPGRPAGRGGDRRGGRGRGGGDHPLRDPDRPQRADSTRLPGWGEPDRRLNTRVPPSPPRDASVVTLACVFRSDPGTGSHPKEKPMNKLKTTGLCAALASAVMLAGCATYTGQTSDPNDPNRTRTGALIGAGIGAVAGLLSGDSAVERRQHAMVGA